MKRFDCRDPPACTALFKGDFFKNKRPVHPRENRVNRRDLIVETAAELFKKHGYNATSVRQIAEAVGVTEAALYYHFKAGKRELFEAVLKDEMPDFIQTIDRCHDCESLTERVASQCVLINTSH